VVFWAGPLREPELVDQVLHPRHRATFGSYELDSDWITDCWIDLAQNHRALRAQVHTHPHEAFHSHTDNRYPVVGIAGFVSIVIPHFATDGLAGARTYELQADGSWIERPTTDAFTQEAA
jgi:hypothetical protein